MTSPQSMRSNANVRSTAYQEQKPEPGQFVLVKGEHENQQGHAEIGWPEKEKPVRALSRSAWVAEWQEVRWKSLEGSWQFLWSVASAIIHMWSEPLVRRVSPQHRPEARHEFESVELRSGGWGRVF